MKHNNSISYARKPDSISWRESATNRVACVVAEQADLLFSEYANIVVAFDGVVVVNSRKVQTCSRRV